MLAALSIAAVLVATLVVGAPRGADAAAPDGATGATRVMFVGDSITHGWTGDTTYRYWVWREFARQGLAAEFVGPTSALLRGTTYLRTDHGFQNRHAAMGGTTYRYHLPQAAQLTQAHRPHLIVLGLGFNDARSETGAEIAVNAAAYMSAVWSVDPAVRFILNELTIGTSPATLEANPRRAEANPLLAQLAAADQRVAIAQVTTGTPSYDGRVHAFDGVHPNPTGETLIAQRVVEAAARLGFLGPVAGIVQSLPWAPKPSARVTTNKRRSIVRIRAVDLATFDAKSFKVRILDSSGKQVNATAWTLSRSVRLGVPRRTGRYTVTVELARFEMVGTPSVAARFKVRKSHLPARKRHAGRKGR